MQIVKQTSYTKHGYSFQGNLLVIDYSSDWKMHPGYGQFGSMSVLDVADEAMRLLRSEYPNAKVLLNIPDIVAVEL